MRTQRAKGAVRRELESLEDRRVPSAGGASGTITARLAPASDPNGDGQVLSPRATIVGEAAPGTRLAIDADGDGRADRIVRANRQGNFRTVVPLTFGHDSVTVHALGNGNGGTPTVVNATRCDPIVAWNTTALDAVRTAKSNPPLVARNLAITQIAVYNAVNAIDGGHESYGGFAPTVKTSGASVTAAISAAADEVLRTLYPQQAATFDAAYAESIAKAPRGQSRARGEALGREAARAILALRADDNSGTTLDAPTPAKPGDWQPTPPKFGPAVALNFVNVPGFAMNGAMDFLAPPPPALDSPEYAAALNEVEAVGAEVSATRTADQEAYAHFWADLPALTYTPPGHWNQIAADQVMSHRMKPADEARMFAALDIALADAGIASWGTKAYYDTWRPVTAIQQADTDGNPATIADPTWQPLWDTPSFPSYTSGHATFSAAAATVLDAFFGATTPFTDTGDPTQHLPARHFSGFDQAADEAALSRMYGGIHFRFDNEAGLAIGRQVGANVLKTVLK